MTMILVRRWSFNRQSRLLLDDLSDGTSPDGPAALANRKAEASANGVRVVKIDGDVAVVTRHDHLDIVVEGDGARDISSAHEELGSVVGLEWLVPAALLLAEDVYLGLELFVRLDGARRGKKHAARDIVALDAAEERPDVVARLAVIEGLFEHLYASARGLDASVAVACNLELVVRVDLALLDATSRNGAAASNRKHILDGHQKGHIELAVGSRESPRRQCP